MLDNPEYVADLTSGMKQREIAEKWRLCRWVAWHPSEVQAMKPIEPDCLAYVGGPHPALGRWEVGFGRQ